MKISGLWKNEKNNEVIKISGPFGSDEYTLEYELINNEFQKSDELQLFISNDKHIHIAKSEKFISKDIFIINPDLFKVDNQLYKRIK